VDVVERGENNKELPLCRKFPQTIAFKPKISSGR